MIAYEILVQTIADWKAGVRPSAPMPHVSSGAPQRVEELSSGVVDLDDGYAAEPVAEEYEETEYEQGEYEEEPPATETYDDDEQ